MKLIFVFLLCVTFFAVAQTAFYDSATPASSRGKYTVLGSYDIGFTTGYGIAIRDDLKNSIWIANYETFESIEFDMTSGTPTGNKFETTNRIDINDQAFCEYAGGDNQYFMGNLLKNNVYVFNSTASGISFSKKIKGPPNWDCMCAIAAGKGNIYTSEPLDDSIAWGTYTGTETSVEWTTAGFYGVTGLAVWGDYLFATSMGEEGDNLFVFRLGADGTPDMDPVWSCKFRVEAFYGSLDFDGEYLWLYLGEGKLYKLELDFLEALNNSTWGSIKNSF